MSDYQTWVDRLKSKWDSDKYYYDEAEADRIFRFASKLKNDRGEDKNFVLLEFQFEIITELLCVKRHSDNRRKHREAHINMARKNGKSFMIAIIVTYLFFCQPRIFGALFILTANTTKQATQLFNTVLNFIKKNNTLRRHCRITESTKTIIKKNTDNTLMVLSSDASNADSFNDYVACLDEVHEAKNDEMYGKLGTGMGTWDEPLLITITTASSGEDQTNLETQLYTMAKAVENGENPGLDSFYYKIFEADKGCDLMDVVQWYKANPALGVFRKFEDLENMAKKAVQMPLQENMFRRMFLNQHVALDSEQGAINMDLWYRFVETINIEHLKGLPCWCGWDLSSKNDVTAFIQVFYRDTDSKYIVYPHLFTPKDTLLDREHIDKNPYSTWVRNNDLIALEGKYIKFDLMLDHIDDLDSEHDIKQIGFDRWGSATILNRLEEKWEIVPLGQGTQTIHQAINDFENLLIDERLVIADNACFNFMAKNVIAVTNENMEMRYSKKKSRFKIDGIIALLMALVLAVEANEVEHYDPFGALERIGAKWGV